MSTVTVAALFTNLGVPVEGLTPTIDIISIRTGESIISGASMVEAGNGFYRYIFRGYDKNSDYGITCDGGSGLPDFERFASATNANWVQDLEEVIVEQFDANRPRPVADFG